MVAKLQIFKNVLDSSPLTVHGIPPPGGSIFAQKIEILFLDETYNALGFSSLAALVPEMQGPNPGNFRFFTTFFSQKLSIFFRKNLNY